MTSSLSLAARGVHIDSKEIDRSTKANEARTAAPAASPRKAEPATELREIMCAAAPLKAAIDEMAVKLQRLSTLRGEQETVTERFRQPMVGDFTGFTALAATVGFAGRAAAGVLAGGRFGWFKPGAKVYPSTDALALRLAGVAACGDACIGFADDYLKYPRRTIKADYKISSDDIQKLIALRDAAPAGNVRAALAGMLRGFCQSVSPRSIGLMSPVAMATLSHLAQERGGTDESPAVLAWLGLESLAAGSTSFGLTEIARALREATPGRERSRLSQAIREHAFSGDACLLPIDQRAQHDLAKLLFQNIETS